MPKSDLCCPAKLEGGSEEADEAGQPVTNHEREQYMMLLDELRGMSNYTAFDKMDAYLQKFARIHNKFQEQNKAIHQGPSDSETQSNRELQPQD